MAGPFMAATGRNTVRPSTTFWPLMASDGEPGDSDDDPGMDVDKVTEELDEGGYAPPPPP